MDSCPLEITKDTEDEEEEEEDDDGGRFKGKRPRPTTKTAKGSKKARADATSRSGRHVSRKSVSHGHGGRVVRSVCFPRLRRETYLPCSTFHMPGLIPCETPSPDPNLK
jgi:hypothetical protein